MSNFYPLEVVCRYCGTQLQVGKNEMLIKESHCKISRWYVIIIYVLFHSGTTESFCIQIDAGFVDLIGHEKSYYVDNCHSGLGVDIYPMLSYRWSMTLTQY